jgi:hypothetical protein
MGRRQLVIASLAVVLATHGQARSADPTSEAAIILESFQARWRLIETIQFEREVDLWGRVGKWPRRMQLTAAGDKFRYHAFEVPFGVGGGRTSDDLKAFNGVQYQSIGTQEKVVALTRHANVRSMGQSPYPTVLWMPLWWLFEPGERCTWQATKNPERWARLIPMVREVRGTVEDGRDFRTIAFQHDRGYWWEVDFATDLGFFPLRSREYSLSREVVATTEMTEWEEFVVDGQVTVVPTRVAEWRGSDTKGHYDYLCQIKKGTLRVNEPIDEAVFTIPPTSAVEIYDLNTGVVVNTVTNTQTVLDADGNPLDPPKHNLSELQSGKPRQYWLLLANFVVIIGLMIAYLVRRRRGGTV